MKKIKLLIVLASFLIALTLIIPAMLVLPFSGEHQARGKLGEDLTKASAKETKSTSTSTADSDTAVEVAVFRSSKKIIEKVPFEDYLVGVVAAEMPAEFKEEALKAQALAARTYIVNRLVSKDTMGVPKGAQVTDTQIHQVYMNDEEMRRNWGKDYSWKKEKVLEAVQTTGGQILTYDGKPIDALFFSTGNGYTENSEDYWSGNIPYLRSVSSPWDKKSPKFSNQKVLTVKEFEAMLGVKIGSGSTIGKIVERTTGKRVGKVNFNGKVLSGKDIREKLDLKSSDFAWERKGENIVITTKGFGHGVGMSQYGANGMAEEGSNYKEIVKHYYKGVEITSAEPMMATITAQK
ncbi:stage II sporulation protein D [Neobacillus sp. WH10]|uniref:stage II sporulation protein D n=1 Tax=Neobacillus sp. WH10 TaxID=3047873 RepID=UPI0024C1931C|nr:stage II sporulation protein D [Neobacillus sp. WH10]WHY77432.1 stage II sporulation protein D [Neobacillus sp. WH10]